MTKQINASEISETVLMYGYTIKKAIELLNLAYGGL